MRNHIRTIVYVFISILAASINPLLSQNLYDSSIQYSISVTEKNNPNTTCKESYKLYVTKQGFQPYLNSASNSVIKGDSYQMYMKNKMVYIKFEDSFNETQNIKLFSLTVGDTTNIDSEIEFPMLCFIFGTKVVFEGVEKCVIEDVIIESYKLKVIADNNNYSIIHINATDFIPLKFDIIELDKKNKDVKSRIVVEIESVKGKFNNGIAFSEVAILKNGTN